MAVAMETVVAAMANEHLLEIEKQSIERSLKEYDLLQLDHWKEHVINHPYNDYVKNYVVNAINAEISFRNSGLNI